MFLYLYLTSNRLINFTNLVNYRHFGAYIERQQHWYKKRLRPIRKRKSMRKIGGKCIFWNNCNGNRKSYPLWTPSLAFSLSLYNHITFYFSLTMNNRWNQEVNRTSKIARISMKLCLNFNQESCKKVFGGEFN